MRVAIYGKKVTKQTIPVFAEVFSFIEQLGWSIVLEKELKETLISKTDINKNYDTFSTHLDFYSGIDLTISLGGDGTFIKTVSYIRNSGVPIMGINTGRMGFLSNISKDQIEDTLTKVKNKEFEFQKRSLLRVYTEEDLFGEDPLDEKDSEIKFEDVFNKKKKEELKNFISEHKKNIKKD
jgi:NAD+ kinase